MNRINIGALRKAYLNNETTPHEVISNCLSAIKKDRTCNAWITVLTEDQLAMYLDELKHKPIDAFPLWGIPFAIKDNIDLVDCETTAGCPAFAYQPKESAFVVKQLISAGAVPVGKTNMDQFATGLVGTRSPFGAVPCVFDSEYISGGSSSGSAYAVAAGHVAFSLGTDTAGSGRVPAAFNELVGVKPSKGLLSCTGVVPACKSLDCVSIFTNTITDAQQVLYVGAEFDENDCYSRKAEFDVKTEKLFTLGVPKPDQLYLLNEEYRTNFTKTCDKFRVAGVELVEIDFEPFSSVAQLLYQGPWVAERFHAVGAFIENHMVETDESVATIIRGAKSVTGKKAFDGFYKLQTLSRMANCELGKVDAILTPTVPTQFTLEEINENPILNNTELGYYTNFMNLLDYAALAIPSDRTNKGMAFGVTLFAEANSDIRLQQIANKILSEDEFQPRATINNADISVAVCGAHLEGMPLNWQLLDREAKLVQRTQTSKDYKFYSLEGGPPFRPGLERVIEGGEAIEVEVWKMPARHFGSFVAGIPAPLGIGKLELTDGSWVTGFICEPCGLNTAIDITEYGSWRGFISQTKSN